MKPNVRILTLFVLSLMILAIPPIEGNSNGIHSQASQGCTCHYTGSAPTLNHNFPSTYNGGQVYGIQISVTGGVSGSNGGFNVEVDKGTMSTGMGIMAVKVNTAGTSATHTTNSYRSWSFDWTAPATGSGDVTVDIAVLTANGANGNSGDAWTNTQLTVPEPGSTNTAPVASNVYISDGPSNTTAITQVYYDNDLYSNYDYSDAENDPDSGTQIRWIKDGTVVSQHNNNPILQNSATTIGEVWTMKVTPSDGTDFGTPVTSSNSVEIIDYDADGDGYGDQSDAFPNDPNEHADSDGDGVGDNADAFPNDSTETLDSDNDGVGDNADAFPNDPAETLDSDGDGTGDNADAFPNDSAETVDSDGDGVGDNSDWAPNDPNESADSDGDGVGNNADAFPYNPNETLDSDNDNVGDNADAFPNDPAETLDSDNDSVGDNADAFPNDPTETLDSDNDGTGDNADAFPNDATEQADNDSDGLGNNADVFPDDATEQADNDSDGVGNNADVFPDDGTETVDSDGDGTGDNADVFPSDANETLDSDGDGVGDNADAFPTDATETVDTDDDGYGDNADAFPTDVFEWLDSDNDSVGDNADAFPNDANETLDSDNDGMGDNEQAEVEAKIAREEEEAAAQQQTLIQGGLGLLLVAGAVFVFLRRRNGIDVIESKDFATPLMEMETSSMESTMVSSSPATVQPVQPMATPTPVQAVELTVENQWTDENGHTWRLMSDGSNLWWNGSDWQKV